MKLYINNKLVKGNCFAYDGCHKIYICEDDDDIRNSQELGYLVYPINLIEDYYNNSCGLRFISNWKLTETYVEQCKQADFKW